MPLVSHLLIRVQSGALGLPESQWSSPFRFRQLWDEDGESLILPGAAAPPHSFAPNATAVAAAYSAEQDQLNELFFAVSSNSQWQQQQVRGLFAAYQEACLHTKDRGATTRHATALHAAVRTGPADVLDLACALAA